MENIYHKAVRAVEGGARFKVDLTRRSLRIDGRYIIREGRYDGELGVPPCTADEVLSTVEELYRRYKHSVPSERSQSKARQYFRALPEADLDDGDMLYGERRDKAQAELEVYLLCQLINGLVWNPETMGSWFWQGKTDKDLVILRRWVEPDCNSTTNNIRK